MPSLVNDLEGNRVSVSPNEAIEQLAMLAG
jgi:hypothetical protein